MRISWSMPKSPGHSCSAQQVFAARGHEEAIALLRGLDVPGLLQRRQPRHAAPGRRAPLRPHPLVSRSTNADVIVIVGTPVRLPHGLRQTHLLQGRATLVQIDLDYQARSARTATSRWASSAIPAQSSTAVLDAGFGRRSTTASRQARKEWMKPSCARRKPPPLEKLMPLFTVGPARRSTPSASPGRSTNSSTEDTIYIGDGGDVVTISAQAVQSARSPGQWMDPGALGSPRRRHRLRDGRQARPPQQGSACATTATAPSA